MGVTSDGDIRGSRQLVPCAYLLGEERGGSVDGSTHIALDGSCISKIISAETDRKYLNI